MLCVYRGGGHNLYKFVRSERIGLTTKNSFELIKVRFSPFVGGRVVSALDCYAVGLLFKSGILPLLKQACGE